MLRLSGFRMIAMAVTLLCTFILSSGAPSLAEAYSLDYPWHKYKLTVPSSSKIREVFISVRQCHPMMAEYDFKVSGILADGRNFEVPLQAQCGGTAFLTIDYYAVANTDGVIKFQLKDGGPYPAQSIDLSSGLLTGYSSLNEVTPVSLGFLGPHVSYNKPSVWNEAHITAKIAVHDGDASAALQAARGGLREARRLRDRELIATSLIDLASAKEKGNSGPNKEIESLYLEAIENANDRYKPRSDGAIVSNKCVALGALAKFYFRTKNLSLAATTYEKKF